MKFEARFRLAAAGFAAVAFFSLAGCGSGLKTSAVSGKVVVEGGDLTALKGSHVELQLDSDPAVRGSGEIKDDGSFEISTLYKGKVVTGAAEGTHSARIVLENYEAPEPDEQDDEDGKPAVRPKVKKQAQKLPIPLKYLDFKNSGWKVTVPTDGSVTLTVSGAKK